MFQYFVKITNATVEAFVTDTWTRFIEDASPWVTTMLVVFVMVTAYLLIFGRVQLSMADLAPRVVRLALVYVLTLHIGTMIDFVFHLFTTVPEAIATWLVQGNTGLPSEGINASIDAVWDRGMDASADILNQTSWGAWWLPFLAIGVAVMTALLVIYITFLVLLSKLAVGILLAVAPFFFVLYLFDATRSLFEGWLRQTLSFALIPVFLYGLLALVFGIVDQMSFELQTDTSNKVVTLGKIASYSGVVGVVFLLSTQVKGWAAGVAGGFSLYTLGVLGAAARITAGGAYSRTMAVAKVVRGGTGLGGRVNPRRLAWAAIAGRHAATRSRPAPRSAAPSGNQWNERLMREHHRS